ncbi:alpha-glucan family phosphorylase [bacterium]|nr:alpha-glucan family phosphorylase [bacterium]
MPKIRKFIVTPSLPPKLQPLLDIARNLWWVWNPEAIELLRRVDPDLWEERHHNPIAVLGSLSSDRISDLTRDQAFLAHLESVHDDLQRYLNQPSWFDTHHDHLKQSTAAYFSFEFGLHECLPLYSGGLGVLAGDHLKSATDLGVPLVGVGLAYQHGYFRQYLNHDGWQQEDYPVNDFYNMAMSLERGDDGEPVIIHVDYPGRQVKARVWRVQVGRNPLFLLDANLPDNRPEDRELTSKLYGGDIDMRIRQEILLGIGGVRALRAMGIDPDVYHLNEGHSAFLTLERIRNLMAEQKYPYETAFELVRSTSIFTTHTPVPAGNDHFDPQLVRTYLKPLADQLGLGIEGLIDLGRQRPGDARETFCMTVLALRLSQFANGVSELHGHVSRDMWKQVWPGVPVNELPISHITNGIHTRSWQCSEIARLYDRYLGPRWYDKPTNHMVWERVTRIPDAELWRAHERMRERLVGWVRRKLRQQLESRGASRSNIKAAREVLDPEALTLGFARRFATYKRATLILSDPERLDQILNNPDRPVQIIFAGKAHPRDHGGKELIRQIVHLAQQDRFRKRIVFLEDYNMEVARYMVQGVDIWLNNPRRPLEASGTSGMKVPVNGGINFSVLDGWWCEGYDKENGWAIGAGEDYEDPEYQDQVEVTALYEMLENEIAFMYYERSSDGVPREWVRVMKNSMRTVNAEFNTNRMVEEYTQRFYVPCFEQSTRLSENDAEAARELAAWRQDVAGKWPAVRVIDIDAEEQEAQPMGSRFAVRARVDLGQLSTEDVLVEIYHGLLDRHGEIQTGESETMMLTGDATSGEVDYAGEIPCRRSGLRGFTVRVIPRNPRFPLSRFDTGLIRWYGEDAPAPATQNVTS